MKSRRIISVCVCIFFSLVFALVDDKLLSELSRAKKDLRKKEKNFYKNGGDPLPIAGGYYQLAMKIQESWMSKLVPGNTILEALESFDRAIHLAENSTIALLPVLLNKGILARMMGRGEESLQAYDIAESHYLYPVDLATIQYNRADALLMMGKVNDSVTYFEKTLKLVPCKTERYYGYISALKELNNFSPAEWTEKLKELKKIERQCIFRGKKSETSSEYDEDYEDDYLPTISPKKSFLYPELEQGMLSWKHSDFYHALSLIYDKLKDYGNAFRALEKSKKIEKQFRGSNDNDNNNSQQRFNRQELIENKNSTIKIFTKEMISSFPDMSSLASTMPIFIIGMMRSGSTLLETILDNHPNIGGMGEDSFFNANLTFLRNSIVEISTEYPQDEAYYALEDLLLDYGDHTVELMKQSVENLYYKENDQDDNHDDDDDDDEKKEDMKHIVDKMLFNYKNIGFLHIVYPNALIINMVRDPMDTLFSCYKNKFDDVGLEWTLSAQDIVLQYVLYLEYVQHFRTVLPGRVLDVRYESLVAEPEKVIKEILSFLQLPFHDHLLQFHEKVRRVQTNSQSQIRQKLYSSSIGQWRKYAKYLEPMKREFLGQLPYLKKKKALVFDDVVNWEMKEDFDYETYRSASNTKNKKSTEKKSGNKVKGKKPSSVGQADKKTSRIVDRNEF